MAISPPLIHRVAPDGGWGWAVVFGSFMISLICDGFAYTTGIFFEEFLEVYKESETMTSMFDSIMTGMIFLTGPLSSGLTVAYGCRKVAILGAIISVVGMVLSVIFDNMYTHCLTLGFITGSGLGLMYLPQVIIVTHWFNKRLAFATGIAVCGTGFGTAIFAIFTDDMIHRFGWKGTMILLSGIMFTTVFYSSLFRKVDYMEENSSLKEALKETFNFKILTDIVFLYFAFANFLNGTVYYVPIIFLKDHIRKTGYGSDNDSTKLMVIFGLSNAFGRAFFGYIADKESLNRMILFAISIICYGSAIGIMAAFGHSYPLMSFCIILFGVSEGAFVCLFSVVMVDLFGVQRVSNAFGIINMILGVASFMGPPIIGMTVDPIKGYTTGFMISSIITIISGILLLFLPIVHRKCKQIND